MFHTFAFLHLLSNYFLFMYCYSAARQGNILNSPSDEKIKADMQLYQRQKRDGEQARDINTSVGIELRDVPIYLHRPCESVLAGLLLQLQMSSSTLIPSLPC